MIHLTEEESKMQRIPSTSSHLEITHSIPDKWVCASKSTVLLQGLTYHLIMAHMLYKIYTV